MDSGFPVKAGLVLLRQSVAYVGHIRRNSTILLQPPWSSIPLRQGLSPVPLTSGSEISPPAGISGNGSYCFQRICSGRHFLAGVQEENSPLSLAQIQRQTLSQLWNRDCYSYRRGML